MESVLAFPGLDGADPENVYVLPSGVVGRKLWLSEYMDVLFSCLALLATVLMLVFESDCAIGPAPRPPRRVVVVRR